MSTASPPRPSIGDPAPWFTARMLGHATDSDFDKAGGRHVLLLLFGSAADPACGAALRLVEANAALLDDRHALFVGVTVDQKDVTDGRLAALQRPGMHFILDADQRVSGLRPTASSASGSSGPAYSGRSNAQAIWMRRIGPGLR